MNIMPDTILGNVLEQHSEKMVLKHPIYIENLEEPFRSALEQSETKDIVCQVLQKKVTKLEAQLKRLG